MWGGSATRAGCPIHAAPSHDWASCEARPPSSTDSNPPGAPSFALLRRVGCITSTHHAFALVFAVVAVASEIGPSSSLGITGQPQNPLRPAGGRSEGEAETTDLSPLSLSLLSPLFSPFSRPPKPFFTLLLSKIACQAPQHHKNLINLSPSTR